MNRKNYSLLLLAFAAFSLAAAQTLEVTSTGLGLGTSTPGYLLDVEGGSAVIEGTHGSIYTTADQYPFWATGVLLRGKSGTPYVVAQTGTDASDSGFVVYNSTPAPLLSVLGDGNVGIGPPSPSAKLAVNGSVLVAPPAGTDASLSMQSSFVSGQNHQTTLALRGSVIGGNYATYLAFYNDYTANTSNYQLAMASGLLFFVRGGDTYPAFSAGGNGTPLSFRGTTNADVGSVTTSSNTTFYNTSSDRRLKTHIRDLSGSGAIVDALRPRLFDWKTGDKDTYGFVAQELYAVFPQAVTKGDDDPETITRQWSMDAAKLVPVLTAEIKDLRARVAALEAASAGQASSVAALTQQLAALRADVAALNRRSSASALLSQANPQAP